VDVQFSNRFETYCGKDSARKPDYLNDRLQSKRAIERAETLESVCELFADYADVYNKTVHTGAGMDGRCPNEVYNTRESKRVIDPATLGLLMQVWSGERVVGKNGVRFGGYLYGQFDAALALYQGRSVRVSYDPDDISSVNIYDAATLKLLCVAEQNELVDIGGGEPISEEASRKAIAAKNRAKKAILGYKPASIVAASQLPQLAIDAQRSLASGVDIKDPRVLELVRTGLEGQSELASAARRLKKAAGAERDDFGFEFDFDFEADSPGKEKIDLGLI
jgi:hypothetical protein